MIKHKLNIKMKTKHFKNESGFNEFIVSLEEGVIVYLLKNFVAILTLFFKKIIKIDRKYLVLVVICTRLDGLKFFSLSNGKIVSSSSLKLFIEYFCAMLNYKKLDNYIVGHVLSVTFKYVEIPKNKEKKFEER
jgi:hypothetical protein